MEKAFPTVPTPGYGGTVSKCQSVPGGALQGCPYWRVLLTVSRDIGRAKDHPTAFARILVRSPLRLQREHFE